MNEPRLPKPREGLDRIRGYRTGGQTGGVRLSSNEWPEPNPVDRYLRPEDLERILLNRYPDANVAGVRRLLAEQWGVQPEQLMLGNGSNEILLSTFLVFGGPGRRALVFPPTYAMYARLAQIVGMDLAAERIGLPYAVERERVLTAVARESPDLICFCSPNNPTGNLIDASVILAAAEAAPDALILVDEAYADFAGVTAVPHLTTHPNLVVVKTFSKVRAAAGLRFGFLIAHPGVIETFDAVRLPYNVSALTQTVAAAIAADTSAVKERIAFMTRERGRIEQGLRAHPALEVFPSVTNFVLFRHPRMRAADLFAAIFDRGVLIRDVSMWPGAEGCLRVTVGTADENARFLDAVRLVLASETAAAT